MPLYFLFFLNMMTTKTIKGQPYLDGNSLTQEYILFYSYDSGKTSEVSQGQVVIIEDIWEDLKSLTGTSKTNGRGYFYWEVEITDHETDSDITIYFNCPIPTIETFSDNLVINNSTDSDWTKYWKAKIATSQTNYAYKSSISPREIVFPGTNYISPSGDIVDVPEIRIKDDNLGDLSNLLGAIY